MIQVADVGIGISGQEGMQVNEPIPKTSHKILETCWLLFVHMNVIILAVILVVLFVGRNRLLVQVLAYHVFVDMLYIDRYYRHVYRHLLFSQAVMSSDFAISRFKHLSKLLLVHGHWCYARLANMTLYFIYKNVVRALH